MEVASDRIKTALHTLKNPQNIKQWVKEHKISVRAWTAFIVLTLLVFGFLSDGDFSFLLTLSSLISMFAFSMVLMKIELTKTVAGVSSKMYECYVILIAARLCSIIPFEGYLPYDRSGDWLYQLIECTSFALACTIVYECRVRFKHTYAHDKDVLQPHYIAAPMLILALIFHPSLNAFMPADVAWTFALYVECLASLPQLYLFHKEANVEPFTSHFLAGQALSKFLSFVFWLSSYNELNDPGRTLKGYVGWWVILIQVLQLVVMGDFIYQYVRCLSRGVSIRTALFEDV